MRELSARLAGIRYHQVPDGVEARGTPMGRAIRHYGAAVPVGVIHAINTVTPDELEEIKFAAQRAELARKADSARRQRENRRAMELEVARWRR